MTIGRVVAAGGVAKERLITFGRVVVAHCVAKERRITVGRVPVAGCEAEEGIVTLSGVAIRIASVRRWGNPESFRGRPKPKASERHRDKKETAPQTQPAD